MADSGALINFGELSKPADTFIEKMSEAVGGLFRPHQIRRLAEAESDAELIRAQTRIKVSEIEQRAHARTINEQITRQENMEAIARKALPQLEENAKPEAIDNDWLTHFFEKCRLVSDDGMREVWSKILAGEANSPGTFSKRALDCVSTISRDEANLFTILCGYTWDIYGDKVLLVFDLEDEIYRKNEINFTNILNLISMNLIVYHRKKTVYFLSEHGKQAWYNISYFGTSARIKRTIIPRLRGNRGFVIPCGHCILTSVGEELAKIAGPKPVDGFFDYCVKVLRKEMHTVRPSQ